MMQTKLEDFEVLIPNLDGTSVAEKVTVRIPLKWDEELEEWLLTPEAHQIIEDTKARHMGLLLPAQFKELRERYGYSQRQMGELFQVGEKSWVRWETGKQRPSRSINLLVRALYDSEISINYLLKRAGKPPREEAGWLRYLVAEFQPKQSYLKTVQAIFATHLNTPLLDEDWEPLLVFGNAGTGKSQFLIHLLNRLRESQPPPSARGAWPRPTMSQVALREIPSHGYVQPRLSPIIETTEG